MMLYEKYRPQKLTELVGQDKAVKEVECVLAQGWGGRPWWISGPTGTGKTTFPSGALPGSSTCWKGCQVTLKSSSQRQKTARRTFSGNMPTLARCCTGACALR